MLQLYLHLKLYFFCKNESAHNTRAVTRADKKISNAKNPLNNGTMVTAGLTYRD